MQRESRAHGVDEHIHGGRAGTNGQISCGYWIGGERQRFTISTKESFLDNGLLFGLGPNVLFY